MSKTVLLLGLGLVVGFLALAPGARAVEACPADGLCARTSSGENGEGACGEPSAWYEKYRRVSVSLQDGSGYHEAYVENFCYANGWGEYHEEGSGLGAGYYSFDWSTGQFSTIRTGWFGYAYDSPWGGGSDCSVYLFSYGMGPAQLDRSERVDCPLGMMPPVLVPELP